MTALPALSQPPSRIPGQENGKAAPASHPAPSRGAAVAWGLLRGLVLAAALGLVALLWIRPAQGLEILWHVVVPALPLTFVVAPGLWRQVCPLATANQLPRVAGLARGAALPAMLQEKAFAMAVCLLVGLVALRGPVFDRSGPASALLVTGGLVLAFAGGVLVRGKAGWCGTFCPLGPVQRIYGQAPVVAVPATWCARCVNCQAQCYDLDPRHALVPAGGEGDTASARQRAMVMGVLPGLVLGYALRGFAGPGLAADAGLLAACALASAGLFHAILAFAPVSTRLAGLVFGALALVLYYGFAGADWVRAVLALAGVPAPAWAVAASPAIGVVPAVALLGGGIAAFRRDRQEGPQPSRAPAGPASRIVARERATGASVDVTPGATLLDALRGGGIDLPYGCRSGLCGADAIGIEAGQENLDPPDETERATLRRLGLEGRARLACVCRPRGPIEFDLHPSPGTGATMLVRPITGGDKALASGIGHVVIVGNGVAGMSTAEALRRHSRSVGITMITDEPAHFYNRMALARLIHDGRGMDGLTLVPETWFAENHVTVLRNTVARSIDRRRRALVLATGQLLPYDRLVLATGAHAVEPVPGFLAAPNAFVMRQADDARQIRAFVQQSRARRALVLGGGVLGIEVADALLRLGLDVYLVERGPRLMKAHLDEEGSARVAAHLAGLGVEIVTGACVERFEGEGALAAAWLSQGSRLRADLVVACLGVRPNVHLAASAGLAVGHGILVDGHMRTSDPQVFAAGDAAEVEGEPGGRWTSAASQAAIAAAALFGGDDVHDPAPAVLRLNCEGIDVLSRGRIEPLPGERTLTAAPDDPVWWRVVLRDDEVVGGLLAGPPGAGRSFTHLLSAPGRLA